MATPPAGRTGLNTVLCLTVDVEWLVLLVPVLPVVELVCFAEPVEPVVLPLEVAVESLDSVVLGDAVLLAEGDAVSVALEDSRN